MGNVSASGAASRKRPAPPWQWLLVFDWFLWATLLFGGFAIGSPDGARSRIPTPMRMASSATLVAAATVAWWSGQADRSRFLRLIVIGMLLGFIGDLFNANLIPIPLSTPVLGGIIAFGLGHVAYIWALVDAQRGLPVFSYARRNAALALWLAVGLVGWIAIVMRAEQNLALRWPALPYSLLLATTAAMATATALGDRGFAAMAVGAALFLFSDLVLAVELFQGSFSGAGDVVWLTYGPGQMLIVYGAAYTAGCFQRSASAEQS